MKKLLLLTLIAVLASACMSQDGPVPQNPLLSTLERKSGLIAYIGRDGNVYVSDQAGGKKKQFTDDAADATSDSTQFTRYQLPTWSPASNQLAFEGTHGTGMNSTAKIYLAYPEAGTAREIYSSTTEFPFYLHWSPDDAHLSFLTTRETIQTDLLIIGGGAGGCMAAIGAKEQGDLDVTVLEKAEILEKRRHRCR